MGDETRIEDLDLSSGKVTGKRILLNGDFTFSKAVVFVDCHFVGEGAFLIPEEFQKDMEFDNCDFGCED